MVERVQNYEVEGDGSVVVEDLEDQLEVQDLVWGEIQVHWQVEVQTLLPWVQEGAYHWLAEVDRDREEAHLEEEDQAGAGTGQVVATCKVRVAAGAHRVQEEVVGRGVQGLVEVLGPWSWASL